jgi:hypothetical protein
MFTSQEDFPSLFDSAQQTPRREEETIDEIAQPLTILQGCLELALASDSMENYRDAGRMALEQVQCISERFASARATPCGVEVFARSQFEAERLAK